jgi:hypothetical protein
MVKPWVNGLVFNPLDIQFFKNVYIDTHYIEHMSDKARATEAQVKK